MKIRIAKKFWKPGQLEVDKSEFSDWSSLTGAASEFNHLFCCLDLFFATLFLSFLTRFSFCRMRFLLSTSTTVNPSLFQVLLQFMCFFLRMLKWWLALYCREYQQCLTYHSSGQTKVLWQHPTIGWKVNNYILHHIYLLVMPISQKPAPRTETSVFVTLQPFTPYSWLVEQRPGGESIFLQITEVLICEDVDEKFVIVMIFI